MLGKVLITRPLFPQAFEFLKSHTQVDANLEDRALSRKELIERALGADGIVAMIADTFDTEVLNSVPSVRVVSSVAVGYNNINVAEASRLGILITNTPGVVTESTADFTWALLTAAARRVAEGDRFVRDGNWKAWSFQTLLGHDIFGKTLGIIGFGRIGQAVARRAMGFGMTLQYASRRTMPNVPGLETAKAVDFETLLRTSDFVTVHVPLNRETTHLIDDHAFSLMKPNCIFVNTSRGPVVDERALVRALQSGRIAGAGLDVFEREPEIEPDLYSLDSAVLAPHIGSASEETRSRMCMMAAENIVAALRGESPPNLVNPEALSSAGGRRS